MIKLRFASIWLMLISTVAVAQTVVTTNPPSNTSARYSTVALAAGNPFVNEPRITAAAKLPPATATPMLSSNCPLQLSQLIVDNCTGVGINTTPEANAILDLGITGTNVLRYVKFNSPTPDGLRIGQHQSGTQFIGAGVTKTAIDENYVAMTGNNTLVGHSAIQFEYDGRVTFLGQTHQTDGTLLKMQPSLVLYPTGQAAIGAGAAPESNATMQVNLGDTSRWINLSGAAWGMRVGALQSSTQFISMGVAKSAGDSNYVANTTNNTAVNHSALEFAYNGSLAYRVAPHQTDGTVLNNLFTTAFSISGVNDSTLGHMGIGAAPSANRLEVGGNLHIASGGLIFQDGTAQMTATAQGPPGQAATVTVGTTTTGASGTAAEVNNSGTSSTAVLNFAIPQGPQGPPGPQITTTYRAFCAGPFGSNDSVVLNPLGQTAFPNCWLLYNNFTVRYVPEFGNASQSGDFPIYIDSPNDTTVDTQYGFAVPVSGTLANLRVSAITRGSSTISGKVLVRKIHTNNTVDNTSSDILLTCTVGTGTSCSDTTHTLSINAGERILVTVGTGSSETLASVSVLVDLE